ncbi:hypothetical protein D3C73_290880 [compost metagenome]
MQHGDVVGNRADKAHVMLHHHQRMLSRQRLEQFSGELGFCIGHARHRLIEQEQLRVLHQQHADLEKLLLTMREQPGLTIDRGGQANRLQHFADPVLLLATEARTQTGPHRLVGFLRQFQVFKHAQRFENGRLLKLATDAGLSDLHFAHLRQVEGFTEPGLAVTGASLAGDHVHQRGLARAVGADDAAQLTDADVQVEIVQCAKAIEADADVFQSEDRAVAGIQTRADALAEADRVATGALVLVRFDGEKGRF